ncbi:MAG: type I methionyl aminopeptidase [Saprospiraceae bacterium]|nr:type I methionyl aminopeptidase [Saprospiraceae bacterium]
MIHYKTQAEIEKIRKSCSMVIEALTRVADLLKPGMDGLTIDAAAEEVIRDYGALPGFKGFNGFPSTLCISKNESVVHGIPDDVPFTETDILSIDCGVLFDGYYGDSAYTFALGEVDNAVMQLLAVTRESLYRGIAKAVEGNRMGDIGHAVQHFCEQEHKYSIVRELVGHGIGEELHEAPEVPNYGRRGMGSKLKQGLVIAIEPMVNMGRKSVVQARDGWTINTKDGKPSAHFEHTVAIGKQGADILSDHTLLEAAIKNNANLKEVSLKN